MVAHSSRQALTMEVEKPAWTCMCLACGLALHTTEMKLQTEQTAPSLCNGVMV